MMIDKKAFDSFCGIAAKWCVLAIVFAAPFSKSISEIAIVAGIVFVAARKLVNADMRLAETDLTMPILLFVVATLPSFFNTHYMALSLKALFTKVLKYAALYLVIVDAIDTRSKVKDLFITALLSAAVILTDGLIQHHVTAIDLLHNYPAFKARPAYDVSGYFSGFPTASFPFPNDFAAWILLMLFPLAGAVIFDLKRNRMRYVAGLLSAGLFYLFFLTKTRAAWIGLALSTVYLAVAKRKAWLILILIIAIAAPFVLRMEMANYIFAIRSVTERTTMWTIGWQIFRDHPIIGNGINTFFVRYRDLRNDEWKGLKGSYAHNCYLQMAADTGVVGLSGFLAVIGAYFISVARNMRYIRDRLFSSVLLGISMGVLAFLVLAAFDTNLYSLNLVTLFWCAVGITQAVIGVSRREAA